MSGTGDFHVGEYSDDESGIPTLRQGQGVQIELESDGGEVKSENAYKLAAYSNTNMQINLYCQYEVHGFLTPAKTQPASLLVFLFQLGSTKSVTRRFTAFRPRITVHADPPGRAGDEPWVTYDVYPGIAMTSFYEVSAEMIEEVNDSGSASLKGPDPSPVELAAARSKMKHSAWTQKYQYTVQAILSEDRSGPPRRDNQVRWVASQQKHVEFGIDLLQVAMLIQRKPLYDLQLTLELDADVDLRYQLREAWDRNLGLKGVKTTFKAEVYETVEENGKSTRKLRDTEIPRGVDRDNLSKLRGESRDIFQALGWAHVPEAQAPKKYYMGTDETHVETPSNGS